MADNDGHGNEPNPDSTASAEHTDASGVSRREVLGGVIGAVVGATVGAAATAVLTKDSITAAPAASVSATVDAVTIPGADNSRRLLGGTPIIDGPFPDGQLPLQPLRERVLALKDLLEQKKVVDPKLIEVFTGLYEKSVGPRYGAAAVAHIWTDTAFGRAVLNPPADKPFEATTLIAQYLRSQKSHESFNIPETPGTFFGPEGEWLRVVANGVDETSGMRIHNIVTCTACSCYPQALLGIQPIWYKSTAYRARTVTSPRGVMQEFAQAHGGAAVAKLAKYLAGIDEVRVWDSNSEVRFLVVPELPEQYRSLPAKELKGKEEQLRAVVTRNSMVGVEIL
jgi:nitrile hydratase subunit alpha